MSGHSKWSTIKHKKAATDAKKGKVWTKIAREIAIAVKEGGEDPSSNSRLRLALMKGRQANMPKENLERAMKKGSGDDGKIYEETIYEGYGPAGVAFMVDVTTDNKNRAAAEIRAVFTKNGGALGEAGSVGWIFERKGVIVLDKAKYTEDDLMELALENGADDIITEEDAITITSEVGAFSELAEALKAKNVEFISAEVARVPKNTIRLEGEDAKKALRLIEALEDNDDVQSVSANFDIDERVMAEME